MDKKGIARQFLERSEKASDKASCLLSLYDGLFVFCGEELFSSLGTWGLEEEKLKAALRYARGDEENAPRVELAEDELAKLKAILESRLA